MISIIVPIYNSDKYIDRCILSLISQTLTKWECILIDDGSTDESGRICDYWQQKESRIHVIHQKNQGASIARQVGIFTAKRKYISFIDADDIIESDYLERLYTTLTDNKVDIAACDFVKHREGVNVEIDRTQVPRILEYEELHHRFFKYDFWGFWGKLYKRDVFDDIYFPKATINEDYVVMAQLFSKYKRMAYVPNPLYHYMMHEGSLSNQKLSFRMMEEWENKKWVYDYYMEDSRKRWLPYAEAQTAETCCKLIAAIVNGGGPKEYGDFKTQMQLFLRKHILSLLFNKHLITGVKLMILHRVLQ